MIAALECLLCREEDLVERRLDAPCLFCGALACPVCARCPGCGYVICTDCPRDGVRAFPGDLHAHPHSVVEEPA